MSRTERNDVSGEYSSFIDEWHQQLISRRKLIVSAAAVVSASLFPVNAFSATSESKLSEESTGQLDRHALLTLSSVQNHLFPPGSHSPGAKEINALPYLLNRLRDPRMDDEEKAFIRKGIAWLDDLSSSTLHKLFIELNEKQREQLLRQIEKSTAGENWLSTVLLYIFEALLCDPVYGGNPNGIGWKWLEHVPGFPGPPADKIYGKL